MHGLKTSILTKITAHTPGPWLVHDKCTLHMQDRTIADVGPFKVVFHATPTEGAGQHVANARLIAAAPALLAALVDAQEELRLLREKDDAGPYDPTLKSRITSAIAAALGDADSTPRVPEVPR